MKVLCLLALLTALGSADGIPVDREKDKITSPHVFLKIDENQREEIVALGTLTLRPEQWSRLRKEHPACPKRIEAIVPKDWNDCLCGVEGSSYAIQWKADVVAVLTGFYDRPAGAGLDEGLVAGESVELTMDGRGQFYHDRKLIPYSELIESLGRMEPAASGDPRWLGVDIPLGMTSDSPPLAARLAKVRSMAEAAGWNFWAH